MSIAFKRGSASASAHQLTPRRSGSGRIPRSSGKPIKTLFAWGAVQRTALILPGARPAPVAQARAGDSSPIVVGSVNALSGPATFPEASAAAKVVFDQVNAEGGIKGRKIDYKILDDKADPATASAAAREVVESGNAVALVGSASLLDCEVNGSYYVQQKIMSVQGTGVDKVCFSNPNISPVNVRPFGDTQMTLTYGSEVLGLKKICGLLEVVGSSGRPERPTRPPSLPGPQRPVRSLRTSTTPSILGARHRRPRACCVGRTRRVPRLGEDLAR